MGIFTGNGLDSRATKLNHCTERAAIMELSSVVRKLAWVVGVLALGVLLTGCPAADQKPAKSAGKQADKSTAPEKSAAADSKTETPEAAGKKATEETGKKGPDEAGEKTKDTMPLLPDLDEKAAPSEKTGVKSKEAPDEEIAIEKPKLSTDKSKTEELDEPPAPKMPDFGPPLVDDEKSLTRLDPASPVWIDKEKKQVILQGTACHADYPLEFFATLRNRAYESVVAIYTRPSIVHAGLLAVGAKPGTPVQFQPQYSPPTGTEIEIEVRWKDKDGKVQHARAQDWIRDIKTKKPMDVNWVFAGSMFRKDPETGKEYYRGDSGDFIAVLNIPAATLDIPIEGQSAIEARSYEGAVDKMPPKDTSVTIVLKPKLDKAEPAKEKPAP
jgi:hypothetical protein